MINTPLMMLSKHHSILVLRLSKRHSAPLVTHSPRSSCSASDKQHGLPGFYVAKTPGHKAPTRRLIVASIWPQVYQGSVSGALKPDLLLFLLQNSFTLAASRGVDAPIVVKNEEASDHGNAPGRRLFLFVHSILVKSPKCPGSCSSDCGTNMGPDLDGNMCVAVTPISVNCSSAFGHHDLFVAAACRW